VKEFAMKFEELAAKVEDLVEVAKAIEAEAKSLREAVKAPDLTAQQRESIRGRVEALEHTLTGAAASVHVEAEAKHAEPGKHAAGKGQGS
jgi:hypothetical protein